ncbi:MAG: PQQ-binding-like beta-propeller repeat protein [Terriglobia bacterium]
MDLFFTQAVSPRPVNKIYPAADLSHKPTAHKPCRGYPALPFLLGVWAAIFVVLLSSIPLCAQNSPVTSSQFETATKMFAVECAGCHGADAHGTDHGPPLVGVRGLRRRSVSWIRNTIHNGIPSGGMPSFANLPADELDALAAFVHALNSPAAESAVPGDRAAGEAYFFGAGKCSSCHMVDGRGSAVGPDLSDVANELTLDELRESLLAPSARITPGYEMVTVDLRDGKTVRGFARSRSNFEIVVQDLKGQFHLLENNQISAVQQGKESLMPPAKASAKELQNLIAYLSSLTGVKPGVAQVTPSSPSDGITWRRILHPLPGDWLSYNGLVSGNRYSELSRINTSNVSQLRLKWIFTVPLWKQFLPDTAYIHNKVQRFGLEMTPIVADGVMYATGPNSAYALDARTGQEIWRYWRPRPPEPSVGDAAIGKNRGMAILGNKIFMTTSNAHLIALNRTTGKLVWEEVMPPKGSSMNDGSTAAPLVVKDMVIAGISGGDWPGVRGFVAAYKASTGQRLWRFQTIPENGEPAAETWGGSVPQKVGGGGTWCTGSYDPETDTLYWDTGNPYPDSNGRIRPGDDLYTNCILALNPETGKLKWYYQVTPHDTHDWDATAPLLLVDAKYDGKQRKLLLFTNKNGFFYVFDRTDGHVLLAKPFVRVNWASGIAPDGRPQLLPESGIVCPRIGTNWNTKAFSPETGLYYVMALEKCVVKLSSRSRKGIQPEPVKKYLRALNIHSGKIAWEDPQVGTLEGMEEPLGVLATAGNLVFYGDPMGDFVAADARTGKTLWHFPTDGINRGSPMTYTVDGKQFVAVAVGPNILCFGLS